VCLCVVLYDVVLDMQIQLSLVGFASAIMGRKKHFISSEKNRFDHFLCQINSTFFVPENKICFFPFELVNLLGPQKGNFGIKTFQSFVS
jgi:hypothetical protein